MPTQQVQQQHSSIRTAPTTQREHPPAPGLGTRDLGWEAPGILILTVLTARIYLHRERQENSPDGTVFLMLMLKQRIARECIFPLSLSVFFVIIC